MRAKTKQRLSLRVCVRGVCVCVAHRVCSRPVTRASSCAVSVAMECCAAATSRSASASSLSVSCGVLRAQRAGGQQARERRVFHALVCARVCARVGRTQTWLMACDLACMSASVRLRHDSRSARRSSGVAVRRASKVRPRGAAQRREGSVNENAAFSTTRAHAPRTLLERVHLRVDGVVLALLLGLDQRQLRELVLVLCQEEQARREKHA